MKNVVDGKTLLPKAEELLDPQTGEVSVEYHLLNGDYLELDDLADSQSHSSTSDNSSYSGMTSDEYFDPIALLQDLEDNDSHGQQRQNSSSQFITPSIMSFEVGLLAATSGSVCDTERQSSPRVCRLLSSIVADDTVKRKEELRDEGSSRPLAMVASLSSAATIPDEKKKDSTVQKRGPKKPFRSRL